MTHIAFIGRAGAGKTTAAEMLVKYFGYERLSFAAPLKVMLGTSTDRERLQEFGTDVVRAYEPDAWVNLFVDGMENRNALLDAIKGEAAHPNYTVDDARFENEVHRLKVEGFVIVRVERDRGQRVQALKANGKLQDEAQLEHVSETELDAYIPDYILDNNDSPEELYHGLLTILNDARQP